MSFNSIAIIAEATDLADQHRDPSLGFSRLIADHIDDQPFQARLIQRAVADPAHWVPLLFKIADELTGDRRNQILTLAARCAQNATSSAA